MREENCLLVMPSRISQGKLIFLLVQSHLSAAKLPGIGTAVLQLSNCVWSRFVRADVKHIK